MKLNSSLEPKHVDFKRISIWDYYEANYGLTSNLFDGFLNSEAKTLVFYEHRKSRGR
jgi:hypothetical protein